jgi:hypothetical protein
LATRELVGRRIVVQHQSDQEQEAQWRRATVLGIGDGGRSEDDEDDANTTTTAALAFDDDGSLAALRLLPESGEPRASGGDSIGHRWAAAPAEIPPGVAFASSPSAAQGRLDARSWLLLPAAAVPTLLASQPSGSRALVGVAAAQDDDATDG